MMDAPSSASKRKRNIVVPESTSSLAFFRDAPDLPTNVLSQMQQDMREKLEHSDQQVAKQKSNISLRSASTGGTTASNVTEFLEEKARLCILNLEASQQRVRALQEIAPENYGTLSTEQFNYQSNCIHELNLLRDTRRLLEGDLIEEITAKKARNEEPEIEFYERIYTSCIVPRVMQASAKKFKTHHVNQAEFHNNVYRDYRVVWVDPSEKSDPAPWDDPKYGKQGGDMVWCHITGAWFPKKSIKAAHLVPKSLSEDEVGYIFGVQKLPTDFFTQSRIGITLHRKIEEALDKGQIVIVPRQSAESQTTMEWECLLVDKAMSNESAFRDICLDPDDGKIQISRLFKWGEFDNQPLRFLSDFRPAPRYLYFRFIITAIFAARQGNQDFISRLKERQNFWPTPEPYLHQSTLTILARNISGLDLPEKLYDGTTFKDAVPGQDPSHTATLLTTNILALTKGIQDAAEEKSATRELDEDEDEDE